MRALLAILILATGLGFGGVARAGCQDGLDAYERGDYATALHEFRPLTEWGNASAQNNLGVMYGNGQGVAQNTMRRHMWSDIGGANGDERGAKNREIFASKMSLHEIGMAQIMAEVCMESNYNDC